MQPESHPAVSVVMAVYNGEVFLQEAVDSVLAQTFPDFELLVVDDGSSDATPQMLAGYSERDPRVVVHRQANTGRTTALNVGIARSRAPLVARLDADDIMLPERLDRQVHFLGEHAAVGLLGGGVTIVSETGEPFVDVHYLQPDAEIRAEFANSTPFSHSGVMFRREVFERAGGYRPVFTESEDLDLWLRMAEHGELANLYEIVVKYRLSPGQASVRSLEAQVLCAMAARASAAARAAGRSDPFDDAPRIDEATLVAAGVTRQEIAAYYVECAMWLGKTISRSGDVETSEKLFALAAARARSDVGSRALIARAHRLRANRYSEEGRHVRAAQERLRAAFADRHLRAPTAS